MSTDHLSGSLQTTIKNGVATIVFGHSSSNAFSVSLLARLTHEFRTLSENRSVVVIILKSKGERAFCAGALFDELVAITNAEEGKAFFSGFAHVINAMRVCTQPIIGRVQGKAVGGGVGLAAACDIVYATTAAAVKLSEITIGIAPLVIAPAVARKIGTAGLAELSLHPTDWKDACWAQDKGLFSKVFPSLTEMDEALEQYVSQLASYHPEALTSLKQALWEGTSHWEQLLPQRASASGRLALSSDTQRALAKFKK